MFQPVSIAKKIQESGNRLFRFVMNPCFRVRRSSPNLNFRSQVPDISRVPNGKFVMQDCFVNSDGVQVFSNVNIIFCNDEFNVSGGSPPLKPAPTAAHSLPIKSQHSKVVMRNCFANANGLQYFNNVKIIFCNQVAHSGSGSTVDFLAPTLTSPWPTPVGQSQSIKLNESSHRLCNKFSPSRSKINPCLILIMLWIAVLRYLQLYASFYPFIADTILHKERRAIKTEHDELKVSKPVPGDGDGTRGSESVREHHRMIQERVSAVISNAPYLLNVDIVSFINNSKAFFEAMYFSMDRKRHDRYSSRNVMLLDINIKGLDGNQGPPIYVGIGCSLRGRPTIDMMPLLRNPPKKTCNCWPKWCYLYCRSRIKNRKVKSIPRKIENKEDTRQIHALENIEGWIDIWFCYRRYINRFQDALSWLAICVQYGYACGWSASYINSVL